LRRRLPLRCKWRRSSWLVSRRSPAGGLRSALRAVPVLEDPTSDCPAAPLDDPPPQRRPHPFSKVDHTFGTFAAVAMWLGGACPNVAAQYAARRSKLAKSIGLGRRIVRGEDEQPSV
jgi:hypothetical protein